ncbi:hypothetical protein HMPREF3220_02209 [Citrobacter koseri]|nr:hypothetical protein HMPREF3220_02209 [Citrobacter koseri]
MAFIILISPLPPAQFSSCHRDNRNANHDECRFLHRYAPGVA